MKRIASAFLAVSLIFALSSFPVNAEADGGYGALTRGAVVYTLYSNETGAARISDRSAFADTDGEFYSEAAEWAAETGLMQGVSEGVFDGDALITRAQISVLFSRCLERRSAVLATICTTDITECQDYSEVPSWARAEMAQAVAYGIIEVEDGLIDPDGSVSLTDFTYILCAYRYGSSASLFARPGNADYSGAKLIDSDTGRELSIGMNISDVEILFDQKVANWHSHVVDGVSFSTSFGKVSSIGISEPGSSWTLNGEITIGSTREDVESLLGQPLVLTTIKPALLCYYFDEDGEIDNSLTKPAYVVHVFYGSADGLVTADGELVIGLGITISNDYAVGEGRSLLAVYGAHRLRESGSGSKSFVVNNLEYGDSFFEISHKGDGEFIIRQNEDILFSHTGEYHGRAILRPTHYDQPLTVDAEGDWTVINSTTADVVFPLAGTGDWVSLHLLAALGRFSDYSKLRISHKGSGEVLIQSVSARPDPSVETKTPTVLLSGTGDCSVLLDLPLDLPGGVASLPQFFEIITDGSWVFELVE